MSDSVSIYDGIAPTPRNSIPWTDAIQSIRNGAFRDTIEQARSIKDAEAYREFKKRLPAATFCGTFNGRRNKDHVLTTTGFIVADLDHLPGVDTTFEMLLQDERLWFAFRSPSGEGIKAGFRAKGITDDAGIKEFYASLEDYFRHVYGLDIDPSCKDISRLTFLSYDPQAYICESAGYFAPAQWMARRVSERAQQPPNDVDIARGKEKYALKVLQSCCEAIRTSTPGSQHHVRLRKSRLMGGYIQYLDESFALGELERAVIDSGAKNVAAAMSTVRQGLAHGKASPIILENKNNGSNGSNACNANNGMSREVTPCNAMSREVTGVTPPKERFQGNLTGAIREYIKENQGSFTTADLDREFGIYDQRDKNARRQAVTRLKKERTIKEDRRVLGKYHILKSDVTWIDLTAAQNSNYSVNMPLGLGGMVNLHPKSICVLAGTSNAGKTAFLLELLRMNLHQPYGLVYLMSEMGDSEYKSRVLALPDTDINLWNEKVRGGAVSSGFDGIIGNHNRDGLTVIDYLEEVEGEYFKITSDIRAIYDSLGDGIAWVALQKHSQQRVGRGGEGTTEKARLYLTIDMLVHQPRCTISAVKIIKAKSYGGENPNGKEIHVKITGGSRIEAISDWMYVNQQQKEKYIQQYEHMAQHNLTAPVTGEREVEFRIPLDSGDFGNLRRDAVEDWQRAMPDIDVRKELSGIKSWLERGNRTLKAKAWFNQLGGMLRKKQDAAAPIKPMFTQDVDQTPWE